MSTTLKRKKYTLFRPMILSRHPSHNILRLKHKKIAALPYRSVIRFGSSTEVEDTVVKGGNRIEINTVDAIKISANKLLMKQKFEEAGVKTAPWRQHCPIEGLTDLEFPIVAKAHYGSKGKGNTLLKTHEEYLEWASGKNLSNYIFEKFMNFGHEFRLHVTENGYFYTCRKALKQDVPEDQKWRRHDDICVWLLETNESFFKPNSWNDIVSDCVKALKAIGADLLSFDVRVQTPRDRDGNLRPYQEYILLECNSASSMDNGTGEVSVCAQKYIEEIPKIIIRKARQNGR
jgi:glutathione synthase/RimK-type ligase-like ATP-grasp enzyme